MDVNPSTNKTKLIGHWLSWGGLALALLIGSISFFTPDLLNFADPRLGWILGIGGVIAHFYGLQMRIGPAGGIKKYIWAMVITVVVMVAVPIIVGVAGIFLSISQVYVPFDVYILYDLEAALAFSLLVWLVLANIRVFRVEAKS